MKIECRYAQGSDTAHDCRHEELRAIVDDGWPMIQCARCLKCWNSTTGKRRSSAAQVERSIFVLVCRDRHADFGISVHATREGADAALEEFKTIYDDIGPGDWKEELWGQPKWCRYVHAHDEGPSAYIEIGELRR
jgi:hypothetical protein